MTTQSPRIVIRFNGDCGLPAASWEEALELARKHMRGVMESLGQHSVVTIYRANEQGHTVGEGQTVRSSHLLNDDVKGAAAEARDEKLEKIAQTHLRVETLETRNSDSLDFYDVSVWSIRAALRQAYEAGRNSR